ncbi:hypothetical protein OIU78_006199 [Salix suchowensis]|nr:hypothetical protein OIU78_006199 [Salix suchowensis]
MESTESSYVSSPEQPQKKSPSRPASPPLDSVEKPTYIKLLVSNAAAGSVIGKGGATITDFQSQSGARIQLSKNYDFFPGTSDRIILISGGIDDALKALELIIAKLLSEIPTEDGDDAEPRMRVRLVVPNNACGSIIGKGGSIIKSFIEEICMLLFHMQQRTTQRTNGLNGAGVKFQHNKEDHTNSVTIGVADEHIGLVVGRGGRNIMEISQRAIHAAEDMIMRKVSYASERETD